MMQNIKRGLIVAITAILMTACVGPRVEVPVAHVGKILTPNGFEDGVINPQTTRLDFCWALQACDKMILLESPVAPVKEPIQLFMPKDKLNLAFDIRFNAVVDMTNVEDVFVEIPSQATNQSRTNVIPFDLVYRTYGQPVIRGVVRNVLSQYTIDEVMTNRENINTEVAQAIEERMSRNGSPLKVIRVELANIQPPDVIIAAQEAAAERKVAIERAEAEARIEITKAERALEVAKKDRLVKREQAEAIREQNALFAQSVTPEWLAFRKLEVLEKILSEGNSLIISPDLVGEVDDAGVLGKVLARELK